MSNIVYFRPKPRQTGGDRVACLVQSFARERRFGDDVFWLKENAELLNILESSGAELTQRTLDPLVGFYERVGQRIGFFPQYYRFLLSITLDLEDLGMQGDMGQRLVDWAARHGLAEAELSDLQRMEARRLMARRGRDPFPNDAGLEDRMRAFTARFATFAMPNKKAAYELTHTVFYLSEYGSKDPELPDQTAQSLSFAGTLAFLDQNADLLAEICIAMRFAGRNTPDIWLSWLRDLQQGFTVDAGDHVDPRDDYHAYFMCNWLFALHDGAPFAGNITQGRMGFYAPRRNHSLLRGLSETLLQMQDGRSGDWAQMRPLVERDLRAGEAAILTLAEQAVPDFDDFFQGFARVVGVN